MIQSEYKKDIYCLFCNMKKLRNKLKGDWNIADRMKVGHHPTLHYLICDNCYKSQIEWKK